jgi:glycosyltransferase involved in cell wall biosynthesis
MIRVLILSPGDDTGSVGINIKQAFDRHSRKVQVRAVRNTDNYARHPFDISGWDEYIGLVNELYDEADIVHWMEAFDAENLIRNKDPKKTVLHHHGSRLRDGSSIYEVGRQREAIQICSTVDLLRYGSEIRWVGNPYNLPWLASFRNVHAAASREGMSIFHSPTQRAVKGTTELIAAVPVARTRAIVSLALSEYRPWTENLRLKGEHDTYYDCPYGIGNNAIEAMGMGIPVIAGLVDSQWANGQVRQMMLQHWGELPFEEHGPGDGLVDTIVRFATNDMIRKDVSDRGLAYVNKFHDERKVVERLTGIYEELMDR